MYIYIHIYILLVIRGPESVNQRSTELILFVRCERRNILSQLNVHLCCVWYCLLLMKHTNSIDNMTFNSR